MRYKDLIKTADASNNRVKLMGSTVTCSNIDVASVITMFFVESGHVIR